MWPGDQQSGGQQQPQGNPPQQPQNPYGTPSPYTQPGYQQPGYPQQPPQQPQQQPQQPQYPQTQPYGTPSSPYGQPGYPSQQQPGGYPTPQPWGPPTPGGPDGGPPQKGSKNLTVGIAIASALAVIAAVVVGVVYFSGGDKKDEAGKDTTSPTPTATTPPITTAAPTPTDTTAAGGGDDDNPRGAPGSVDVQPVIPGWKVVRRGERNVAFDVPPDWTVDSEGMSIGFEDKKGNPQVVMGAPAYYKHEWCKASDGGTADRAATGTKGGSGASSLRSAAENEAEAWAYWAYQTDGKGTFSKAQNSKAFSNSHGISGWQAQATASNIPKANKCTPPGGIAYTVAWLDPAQKATAVVWVLYADTGVSDQLSQAIVDKIKSSIRPLKE